AALTVEPSGTSILMPVPREAAKSVMMRPETGQRNLSLPDIAGSAAGVGAGCGLAAATGASTTGAGAGVGAAVGAGAAACWTGALRPAGRAVGRVWPSGAGALASWVGAVAATGATFWLRSPRPGMVIFWPTT